MKKWLGILVFMASMLAIAAGNEVTYKAADGLTVNADSQPAQGKSRGLIALFHQADANRFEYEKIAPKLNAMGFATLAVDQRSGGNMFGGTNKTAAQVKGASYLDTLPDLQASVRYAKDTLKAKRILIWGSSYSSALVFLVAANDKDVAGVLAFSPDEYLAKPTMVRDAAKNVRVPVFITSTGSEADAAKQILMAIASTDKTQFIPKGIGAHGSSILSNSLSQKEFWGAVEQFLNKFP